MNPSSERELELIEQAAVRVGMTSLMNNGAASCVHSEGCNGVTQEHLIAFAREIALHCAAALSTQPQQAGWKMVPVTITEEMRSAAVTAWVHSAAFYGKPCAGQRAWDAALNAAPLPPAPVIQGGGK